MPHATFRSVRFPPHRLTADISRPVEARGVLIFAHGSGSSRLSPRNRSVAQALADAGYATVLFDLLTDDEAADRANVFDIDLLGARLVDAIDWVGTQPDLANLPIGLFGASTGAAAALMAASERSDQVTTVISRGGRPDLAGDALGQVAASTLLIVGGDDEPVLSWNREAMALLAGPARLEVVPGASHLFEEPGALDEVVRLVIAWCDERLAMPVKPADR